MKLMRRNCQKILYCLYKGETDIVDENGYKTGEKKATYSMPKELLCSVSAATGYTQWESFGRDVECSKVIVTDDPKCPIDEHTVLFIDKPYETDDEGTPLGDYVVRRKAETLNCIAYAVGHVEKQ